MAGILAWLRSNVMALIVGAVIGRFLLVRVF